jgi:hypothetical protein
MSAPGDDSDTDALLARANRLLARHRAPSGEVPTLHAAVPAAPAGDDGIPVLTDVIAAGTPPAAGAALPPDLDRAVEQALASVTLDPAQRDQVRRTLEETLYAQMKKLRPQGGSPQAPDDGPAEGTDRSKPPV